MNETSLSLLRGFVKKGHTAVSQASTFSGRFYLLILFIRPYEVNGSLICSLSKHKMNAHLSDEDTRMAFGKPKF